MAAGIDTIEVLNNLQFEHLDTADIYTVNAAGQAGESVATFPFAVDPTVLAVRVVFNNGFGATGSTVHGRVRATKVTGLNAAGIAKTQNIQALEWTAMVLGTAAVMGIFTSAEIDTSAALQTTLHIDLAVTGTTAHLGTEIIVQGRKEATVNEWTVLGRWQALAVTAFKSDVLSTAAAGQKVIPVNNPTAGNLNKIGKHLFILDSTVQNSEIVFITQCGADA